MAVGADPRVGSELLGFRVEALLGRGGMGVVYRAEQRALGRKVALKLLAPELAGDAVFRARFLRESRLAASIEHPSIVPVYDAGEVGGLLYSVMRYVEGVDLRRLLGAEGPLAPARAVALLEQVGAALDAAHARGLVHRDVKPSNVLVAQDDRAYLSDFGLTTSGGDRGTGRGPGRLEGTVDYVAPEQIEGGRVDRRADVYSLGCVLFECLTGELPFPRASELAVLWAHVQERPPRPSERRAGLPVAIDAVLAKALAKDPGERYASCGELMAAARSVLLPEPAGSRTWPRWAAVGALVAALTIGAAVVALRGGGAVVPLTEVDSLARIDARTNRLTASVDVGNEPDVLAVAADGVWVGKLADVTISRVDLRSVHVAQTRPVNTAGGLIGPPLFPTALAAAGDRRWIGSTEGRLLLFRGEDITPAAVVLAGAGTVSALAATGAEVWAATLDGALWRVREIADGSFRVVRRLALPPTPTGLAFGYGSLWVITADGDLVRIDPRRGARTARYRLGFAPTGLASGAGGIWLADRAGGALVRLDPADGHRSMLVSGLAEPRAVAVGFGSVWAATSQGVVRVDPSSASVVARIGVGPVPVRLALGSGAVWVSVQRGR